MLTAISSARLRWSSASFSAAFDAASFSAISLFSSYQTDVFYKLTFFSFSSFFLLIGKLRHYRVKLTSNLECSNDATEPGYYTASMGRLNTNLHANQKQFWAVVLRKKLV